MEESFLRPTHSERPLWPEPRRFSDLPRPFLKWVGSKQALIRHIIQVLPNDFDSYFEPFLGSGALLFYLKPKKAYISDTGSELVDTWIEVRDNIDLLVDFLRPLKPDKDLYYHIRENRSLEKSKRAGEFLYLNRTCWNGLYRVNSKGKFNVPYGAPRSDFIFDEENLRACSKMLNRHKIDISCKDFEKSVVKAKGGDLVYFDPPYVSRHNNNGFRDWNEQLFSWEDQIRLSDVAKRLQKIGVKVIVSNANHKDIVDLYDGFEIVEFDRSSTLSSSARFRGKVGEVLITTNI